MRTGTTFQDDDGMFFILVPTLGEDGKARWAGPFPEREDAIEFCPEFGAAVEAPEVPDIDTRCYVGGAY